MKIEGGNEASWPSAGAAWYAVIVLAVVLMFGTMENQIITYLIQPIKRTSGSAICR